MASVDTMCAASGPADAAPETGARHLPGLTRLRGDHFRRAVMADGAMGVMLSLPADPAKAPLTRANLALANFPDGPRTGRAVESLIHAGLVALTGANPDRRTVGLTPLGSARMRSYISDYPDI